MGAWGSGIFENDDAQDFLLDYKEAGPSVVEDVLMEFSELDHSDYMDVDIGSAALAAAEIVATCYGQPNASLAKDVQDNVVTHCAAIAGNKDLVSYAKIAPAAIMSPDSSELYQLWEEADAADFSQFKSVVADLEARLGKIA